MYKNPYHISSTADILLPANLNFSDFFLKQLWMHRDKIALINAETEETIKFGEIVQQGMNFAISLSRMGVRKGQTIAVYSENCQWFFGAIAGIIFTGASASTINVTYTKGELQQALNITKPKYIICSPSIYKKHKEALKKLSFLEKIVVFGNEKFPNTLSFKDLAYPSVDVAFEEFKVADVEGNDTLFVLYSSGTTGLPKGVMLSHHNVLTAASFPYVMDANKMAVTITPWYHVMGLMGNIIALTTGRTGVYLSKFNADMFLKIIEKYKITQVTLVPPIIVLLSKYEHNYDVSSVQLVACGAAPLHKDTIEAFTLKFPNAIIYQGYGMTEFSLVITRASVGVTGLNKIGSVGQVLPTTVIKVVDLQTRKALGPNQPGEICAKGPMLMKGYVGKPRGDDFDDEGFYKTGDIGYYDDDKQFFIVDRLKELIKYKGIQVPPAEIEAVLLQHQDIKDAGVIGIAHKSAGEVPMAFVVRQPGVNLTEDDVKAFVAEKLSNPKHLRGGVRFLDEIPKSPSGKIMRKTLKGMIGSKRSKL